MLQIPATFLSSLLLLAPAADGWLGIYLDMERDAAVVAERIPGSPAEKAGIEAGDVLIAVDDKATPTREAFTAEIRARKAGDRVSIKLKRAGKEQIVVVKLGERPEQAVAVEPPPASKPSRPQAPAPAAEAGAPATAERGYLGVSVQDSDAGVRLDRVLAGSPAAKAGLRVGDVLTTVGDVRIESMADVDRVLGKAQAGSKVAVGVRNDDGARAVTIVLGKRPSETTVNAEAAEPSEPAEVRTVEMKPRRAPAAETTPAPAKATAPAGARDLEAELKALRAELAELRKQVEALRQGKGRE